MYILSIDKIEVVLNIGDCYFSVKKESKLRKSLGWNNKYARTYGSGYENKSCK